MVTAAIGCLVVVAGLFGGYLPVGGNAVLLFYLVAVGSAAPVGTIPQRAAGVAFGGALAVVASLLLWGHSDDEPLRAALAEQMRLLGTAMVEGGPDALGRPPLAVRRTLDRLPERPAGPTRHQRAALFLLNDLERLEGLVRRAAAAPPGSEERLAAARAGDRLRRAADFVDGPAEWRPGFAVATPRLSLPSMVPLLRSRPLLLPRGSRTSPLPSTPCDSRSPGVRPGPASTAPPSTRYVAESKRWAAIDRHEGART